MANQPTDSLTIQQRCIKAAEELWARHLDPRESQNYLDKAQNLYAQALEQEPAQASVLGRMARLALKQCRFLKAEQYAKKALKLDDHCYDAWHTMGYLAYRQNDFKTCAETMEKAAKVGGLKASKSHLCLQHTYKKLSQEGGWKLKLKSFKHMLTAATLYLFEKDRLNVWDSLFIVPQVFFAYFLEESRETDRALKLYMKLYDRFPGLSSLSNAIGGIYRKRNQQQEALYWFEKTVRRHPSNEFAYFQRGQMLEEKHQLESAADIYEALLNISPNDAHVHCSLGNVYYTQQLFDDALSHYKAALTLGEDKTWRALLAQSIGNMHLECFNNPEASVSAFQLAIELNPDDVDIYIQLGLLHFKLKDFQNARLVYHKAIQISPKNPRLYSNLGYLYWMENNLDEAETLYKQAIALDPFYEIPYNNLGVIYLDSLGKIPQAIELLEKATSLNESYALAFYNLGRAYSFLDQKLHAAQCFQTAKKLNTFTKELDNEELVARINYLFEPNAAAYGDAE